jgi:hypothetical protein
MPLLNGTTTRDLHANGAVRVALLDVIEPAAAAFYLLILHLR